MSILTSPRVHFVGTISWDPGLANNSPRLFDARRAEVNLPSGVTNESFPQYLIDNMIPFGIWNLYGTHDARFETNMPNSADNTRVVSGRSAASGPLLESDPLLGKPLTLRGKLVDLDPEAVWNSQIFFDRFQLGDATVGLTAQRHRTMHSRWINFRRNLDRLEIAGGAGVVWQTVFPRDSVQYVGLEQSPLLAALKHASESTDSEGIMLRLATYRTLYFQNGVMNSQSSRPRNVAELQRFHADGKFFTNPAYSRMVGTIGVWNKNDPESWPGGRFLVPVSALPPITVGGQPIAFGPSVVEVDQQRGLLHLDLGHTIPELTRSMEKPNVGDLFIGIRDRSQIWELARLAPDSYGRAAYEREAGVVSVPVALTGKIQNALKEGRLVVRAKSSDGQYVTMLEEEPLVAVVEQRDIYSNENETTQVPVRVFERGAQPSRRYFLAVAEYQGQRPTGSAVLHSETNDKGEALVELPKRQPSAIDFAVKIVDAKQPNEPFPDRLDITAGNFFSVRVLPTDEEVETSISDEELTWDLIYDLVLRHWDLLNPIMNLRSFPLSDREAVLAAKAEILNAIRSENHETTRYMPITRDLSIGKRRLLERWLEKDG